jgi:creatinine amidohydrolase
MHSHPQLVQGTAPEEYPTFPIGVLVRDKRRYWPGGVWGDPSKATVDKGARIEELVVRKVVELVKALEEGRYV